MSLPEVYELVGSFAEAVVQVREPAVLWPTMLRLLHEAIGFDAGYIAASWGPSTEGRGAIVEHDEPFMKRNLDRFLTEISAAEIAAYTDRARTDDEIWPALRRKELAVFDEVLLPTGMRHMLVRVSSRQGNIAGFNLERRRGGSTFTERELALVDVVAPFLHIAEVLTLAAQDDHQIERFAAAHGLSKREKELTALACKGLQNGEIGMVLGLSANTVRNTLVRVFEKVGVSKRAELAYLAARAGATDERSQQAGSERPHFGAHPLAAFAQRVREASERTKHRPASSPAAATEDLSGIRYTPPLLIG